MPSVCAVVVTYHPDLAALTTSVEAVRPQVGAIVVVDNSVPPITPPAGVTLLAQGANVGLAAAQNAGIGWAREQGHTHVLILDQDSEPAPDMVAELLSALAEIDDRVGAVGPLFRDPRAHTEAPFIKVAFPVSHKLWCTPGVRHVKADFLISSGALIPLAVLDDVGGMDDGLFIDNVDMEWSFRARSRGYALYGVCAATMTHHLGDDRVPTLGGRVLLIRHGPVRLYFIMRNRVALYRMRHTPRVWIAQDLPRVLRKFLIFTVLLGPRRTNARYMVRGLRDGVRRRTGPCPLVTPPGKS